MQAFKHLRHNSLFKGFQGEKKCALENNIHGKTAFTSFLLRSSQIIGNDEQSIENSEFSWEKNLNDTPTHTKKKKIFKLYTFKKLHRKVLGIFLLFKNNY